METEREERERRDRERRERERERKKNKVETESGQRKKKNEGRFRPQLHASSFFFSFCLLRFFSPLSSHRITMNATAMSARATSRSSAVSCRAAAAPAGRATAAVAPLRRSTGSVHRRNSTSSSSSKLNGAAVANASSKTLAVERVQSDEDAEEYGALNGKRKRDEENRRGLFSFHRRRRCFLGRSPSLFPLPSFPPLISNFFPFATDLYEDEFEDEDDGTGLTGSQVRNDRE